MGEHDQKRLDELLADRAVQGLSPAEQRELKELIKQHPEWPEWGDARMDLAAAAVDLADLEADEPLPEALRARILADAEDYLDAIYPPAQPASRDPRPHAANPETPRDNLLPFTGGEKTTAPGARSRVWQTAGWCAAAACLIVAVLGWYPRLMSPKPAPPTLAELRSRLMTEAPDVVRTAWVPAAPAAATADPGNGVRGDVVWSTARQQGFMKFQGMPALDPSVNEYQLWIFDAEQDERYPVDGGVFDVTEEAGETGEVIVRIDAKIRVSQPKLFAVTVEKPGGVVVSKRDTLMLVAKVD